MGGDKTEQPKISEVAISPAVMIFPSASTAATAAFPKNAAKAATKPLVEILKHIPITAVLEVPEPAAKRLIQLHDHALQRFARRTVGLAAKTIFQLLEALLSRPVFLAPKFEPQKRKALHARVHDPRLRRVQREAGVCHPRLNKRQSRFRSVACATQHHKVVCVANHFIATLGQQMVQRIEIHVTQQRTENSPLRRSGCRSPFIHAVQNTGCQKRLDQRQQAAVGDLRFQLSQQLHFGFAFS